MSPLQVLSGCAIIVRGQPRGGPPPERQINLSNIRAGALARRAAQGQPDTKDVPDEVSSNSSMACVCLGKDDGCVALNSFNTQLVVLWTTPFFVLFVFLLYAERSPPSRSVRVTEAVFTMTLFLIIVF